MPPPPPPPGPPPPPVPLGGGGGGLLPRGGPPKGGGASDRGALLKSIQQGKALKKTVTNDRSAPSVNGSSKSSTSNNNSSAGPSPSRGGGGGSSNNNGLGAANSASTSRLPGIGGLFSEGMPKLRSTQGGVTTGRMKGEERMKRRYLYRFFIAYSIVFWNENLWWTNTLVPEVPLVGGAGQGWCCTFERSIPLSNVFAKSPLNWFPCTKIAYLCQAYLLLSVIVFDIHHVQITVHPVPRLKLRLFSGVSPVLFV